MMRLRRSVLELPIVFALTVALTGWAVFPNHASAEPPRIGEPSPLGEWFAPLHPTNWSMPKVKFPPVALPGMKSERRVIRPKSDSMVDGFSKSVSRGWSKTKSMLDPSKMWPASKAASKSPARPSTEQGFWAGLFSSDRESERIETPNDFLRQPRPY